MATTGNRFAAPTFSPRLLALARELARALFDDGGAPIPDEKLAIFSRDLADYGRHAGLKTRLGLRAALLLLQWSPAWVMGKPGRFTGLSREDRVAYLMRAEEKSLRLPFQGMKTVFAIIWYDLFPGDLPDPLRRQPRAGVEHLAKLRAREKS